MSTFEDRETRLKRLKIRSWRRGTKEMDLILGPFADDARGLAAQEDRWMDGYEAFLDEGDNDLYLWVSGTAAAPEAHGPVIAVLRAYHKIG